MSIVDIWETMYRERETVDWDRIDLNDIVTFAKYLGTLFEKALIEVMHKKRKDNFLRILDVGCGSGKRSAEFLKYLQKRLDPMYTIRYFGLDVSETALKKARRSLESLNSMIQKEIEFQFLKLNVYEIDNYKQLGVDKGFDIIINWMTLHDIYAVLPPDHEDVFNYCVRIYRDTTFKILDWLGKPGIYFLKNFFSLENTYIRKAGERALSRNGEYIYKLYISIEDLYAVLRNSGIDFLAFRLDRRKINVTHETKLEDLKIEIMSLRV